MESPGLGPIYETYTGGFDVLKTRTIFYNAFDFFGILDSGGRVVELNGSIFEKASADPSLLKGQIFSQTVFWQSSENTAKVLETAIGDAIGGRKAKVLLDFRVSADNKIVVELSLLPQSEEDGGDIFFYGQQITDRKDRAEYYKQQTEELLFAAENAGIGLWFWDFTSDKIYSTPKCNEMFEVPAYDKLTYEKFISVVHSDDRQRLIESLEKAHANGTRYSEEYRVVYTDGRIEWIAAEGKSFLDANGKPEKMTSVVRKITEEKLEAEELSVVYEREKRARDEAVEANRAKDLFLAFVSHELRSPLNAILGWSKILLTKNVDDETRKNALETIERSARVQTKLINDLVDSARVASGKIRLEFRPTNLYEVVKVSFNSQKPSAEANDLNYDFTSDSKNINVFGDAGRLQQVFSNLISNAVKFTPPGGKVSIDIRTDVDVAVVTVEDSGRGISEHSLPNIFRQFSQADPENEESRSGLGLGLSIVNTLVSKHGGTVVAHSDGKGHGSRFAVTLPLSAGTQVSATPQTAEATKDKPLDGLKIILVEDDPDSREVLQLFLEQNGAVVRSTDSAQVAINMLAGSGDGLPDLLISDLAMPNEDGYTMISRIRDLPEEKGGAIPALALSAFASMESRQRAVEAGFHRYSTKPFEPDHLIPNILDLVGRT
jgi:signal transduction histidine kinase/ActR/RegA family two-component response regulator